MIEIIFYSLLSPWGLALVTSIWLYPAVLEEVVKWAIVKWRVDSIHWTGKIGCVVGVSFGVGELMLFSLNSWMSGDWQSLLTRLLITVPMHGLTGAIIGRGMQLKMGLGGVLIAMIVHAIFNRFIG